MLTVVPVTETVPAFILTALSLSILSPGSRGSASIVTVLDGEQWSGTWLNVTLVAVIVP